MGDIEQQVSSALRVLAQLKDPRLQVEIAMGAAERGGYDSATTWDDLADLERRQQEIGRDLLQLGGRPALELALERAAGVLTAAHVTNLEKLWSGLEAPADQSSSGCDLSAVVAVIEALVGSNLSSLPELLGQPDRQVTKWPSSPGSTAQRLTYALSSGGSLVVDTDEQQQTESFMLRLAEDADGRPDTPRSDAVTDLGSLARATRQDLIDALGMPQSSAELCSGAIGFSYTIAGQRVTLNLGSDGVTGANWSRK